MDLNKSLSYHQLSVFMRNFPSLISNQGGRYSSHFANIKCEDQNARMTGILASSIPSLLTGKHGLTCGAQMRIRSSESKRRR